MNPKLPYELLGTIDFSLLARAILWNGAAKKLVGLRRLGRLAATTVLTPISLLGMIDNSRNGRSMRVIIPPWRGGRVPCVHLTSWPSGWLTTPTSIDPDSRRHSEFGLVVSVYFTCDWIRALLDIAHERSKSLLELDAEEIDPLHPNPNPFFNNQEILMRWVIATSWPVWRRTTADWKQMYASLRSAGFPDFSIRTLQRKSKMMGLLKDW